MLRQLFAMTRKELQLFLQRPGQWAMLLLTPLAFVAIMGQVFGGGRLPTAAVYLVNEDEGRLGAKVADAIADEKSLDVQVVDSRAEADRLVGAGRRMAAIVIPAGFSDATLTDDGATIEVIVDPAREQTAGVVLGQVQAATAPFLIDAEVTRGVSNAFSDGDFFGLGGADLFTDTERAAGGVDLAQAQKFLTAALRGIIAVQVEDAVDAPLVNVARVAAGDPARLIEQPTIFDYLVPGYTFFFAFFLVGIMAETVLDERRSGALRRLLTTPARRAAILGGKIAPFYAVAVAQILLVMGLSSLVFDYDLGRSPAAFLIMVLASAAAVVGLGIMVAALVRSEGQASSFADLAVIAMAVVSGAMFPTIFIPVVRYFTPHYWAIQGFQDVVTRNLGPAAVVQEAGILLVMAAAFFAVGVARFKFE